MAAEKLRRRLPGNAKETAASKPSSKKDKSEQAGGVSKSVAIVCAALLSIALLKAVFTKRETLTAQSYLPLVNPDCCTGNEEQLHRLWGSYRPQVYFGMRPRIPESVIHGLMWLPVLPSDNPQHTQIRHTSEQNQLRSFTWNRHDGNTFGQQTLNETGFTLETSFVKTNVMLQDWTARIKVTKSSTLNPDTTRAQGISLFWYLGVEHSRSTIRTSTLENGFSVYGNTEELGPFTLTFKTVAARTTMFHSALQCYEDAPLHRLGETVRERLQPISKLGKGKHILAGLETSLVPCSEASNAVVMQITLPIETEVEVVYENLNIARGSTLEGALYDKVLKEHIVKFDKTFEEKFKLKAKGYDEEHVEFAKSTFSNLIGGIGYFYGSSIVTSSEVDTPVKYWPAALYSAVPSRSFFPRGFLWDEGFHQLLISKWDKTISLEVIGHWVNLMNADGWIPREQILGKEALMKVPSEFVVQNADYANPPTLFLALDSMLNSMQPSEILDHHASLKKVFHRLSLWYNWYNTTQTGPLPTTYRWRGRNGTTDRELNPKTLTSGLDDYPRATHPTDDEYHVDLRCWMAFASRSMVSLGDLLGINVDRFRETAETLADNDKLKELHWNGDYFTDYGLHSDIVGLKDTLINNQDREKRRVVRKLPTLQLIKVQGYINLFPFILTILEPTSPELGHILNTMKSESGMWGPYGLCSLSKKDSYYNKYNTAHDAPYWRGPVWININFLAIRALDHYAHVGGPHAETAAALYTQLRKNVAENMFKEYKRTGYVWEQYHCQTGRGQSVHPFTGWSSLVVLIMGEQY